MIKELFECIIITMDENENLKEYKKEFYKHDHAISYFVTFKPKKRNEKVIEFSCFIHGVFDI